MPSWLDDVLGITGTILRLGVLGPVGVVAGQGVGAISTKLKIKEDKANSEREAMLRSWMDFAKSIDALESLTNVLRWEMLTETIARELTARTGKEPKQRQVETYAQVVVSAINGDFEEAPRSFNGKKKK